VILRLLAISVLLLVLSCRADYDIEEVADEEYLGESHHSHDLPDSLQHEESLHDHSGDPEHDAGEEHAGEHKEHPEDEAVSGHQMHVHQPGERNHGTEWFFNQPWAAKFIWGKMLRDSVVLILLAGLITFFSGRNRK